MPVQRMQELIKRFHCDSMSFSVKRLTWELAHSRAMLPAVSTMPNDGL